MIDSQTSTNQPVDEPGNADEVVESAEGSLAEAAAAADAIETTSDLDPAIYGEIDADDTTPVSEPVADVPDAAEEQTYALPAVSEDAATRVYDTPPYEPAAETIAAAPIVTASEPALPPVAPAPQPIFVQAPEAPRPRGNRAATGAIGLLAALAFGVLYLGAALGLGVLAGDVTAADLATVAAQSLGTWALWVPIAVFFLAFWLLGAIINRGRWGVWVILGLLVGVVSYGGHLLGQLFQAPFWMLTASQGAQLVEQQLLAPLAIAAFVFGRELTIWFGAWAAARGKRVTELNIEARREYERTLEAGPQLVRP